MDKFPRVTKSITLLVVLIMLSINISYAVPVDTEGEIKVILDDELLEFDVSPVIVNNRTMVPMRSIFEYLGSQVIWYNDTRTVVGYKDNMFIKLTIGSTTAYKNGKSFTLDSPPIIKNSRTLVPVRFIAESFGMQVEWDESSRTVILTSKEGIGSLTVIDNLLYKSVSILDYGLKLMVPEYWEPKDDSNHSFYYSDDSGMVDMNIEVVKFSEEKTLDEFTQENKEKILDAYKGKVVFTGNKRITVNNVDIYGTFLRNSAVTPEINQAIYYTVTPEKGYIISFSYTSESNDSQLMNIFNDIINSLVITDLSVVYNEEHYLEYDKFFELGIKLDNEIYSNMEVKNKFNFKGSVKEDAPIDHFYVQVSKNNDFIEGKIPIEDSKFNSEIFTPFGLGKHNIVIGTPVDEDNMSQYIMQFSVINTSKEELRYLIPSRFIEKDDEEITALAQEITKDYYTDYDKARAIFEWIAQNIDYDMEASPTTPRSAKEVLTSKKGDCDELSFLYAALARAVDIPTRIASGKIEDELHAWNELMVNGKWIIADVTWGSGYVSDDDNTFVKELNMNYFNPTRSGYEKRFKDIEYLPY